MILLNSLYKIISQDTSDSGTIFDIELNPGHIIYSAHFPQQPITPGVCIIQIAKELLEIVTGRKLETQKLKNVKFTAVISPDQYKRISVKLTQIQPDSDGNSIKAQALIYHETTVMTKVSIVCKIL